MSYDDLTSKNIPLVTLDLIDDAIRKYNIIKNKFDYFEKSDCLELSFILSFLTNDVVSGTKDILKKYNINEKKISGYFNLDLKEFNNVGDTNNLKDIYDTNFREYINELLEYYELDISDCYPENIIVFMMEFIFFDELLNKCNNTEEDKKILAGELLEYKDIRKGKKLNLNNPDIGITYDKLTLNHLPLETISLIKGALEYYELIFNQNDYSNELIKTNYDKVALCFFVTISESIIFNCAKVLKEYLKKINYGHYEVLKYFNLDKDWMKEYQNIPENKLKVVYNGIFKKELERFFLDFSSDQKYIYIYPESILRYCSMSSIIYDFYNEIGLSNNDFEKMSDKLIVLEKEKYKLSLRDSGKCFNINNYSSNSNNYKNFQNSNANNNIKNYSLLCKYGYFLDEKEYISNPAVGREEEIKSVILSLLTPNKSSILVGPAGVGKTAIVEGLAYLIKNNKIPKLLENKKIISISTNSLLSGCRYRGEFEERVEQVLNCLKSNKEVILFIDEIHTIIGAGEAKGGALDLSNILKPYLDRGDVKIIGATTEDEYNSIMTDPALRRRFEKTDVKQLDSNVLKSILNNEITNLENIFNIKFDFNYEEREFIINFLINLTKDKNQTYYDKENNPSLVLSILNKSFVIALYNNREYVIIDDIKESINMNDRIYDSVKMREIIKLIRIDRKESKEKVYSKVIKLPLKDL